jgi:hypothetical protein
VDALILANAAGRNGVERLPSDLNLDARSRLSALAAWVVVVSIALGFVSPLGFAAALFGLAILAAFNFDLYRFFGRRGGLGFAAVAFGLHALYLLYSSLIFVCLFSWNVIRQPFAGKSSSTFKHKHEAEG